MWRKFAYVVPVFCALTIFSLPLPVYGSEPLIAVTEPSDDVVLSFVRPGRVEKIAVKEGDQVKADQELVILDDRPERAELARLKAQAESEIRVNAAIAQLDQKKLDLKKIKRAYDQGASTDMEYENAKLEVIITELSVKLAEFEKEQAGRQYEQAKASVDKFRLKSPVTGRVEKIEVERGESVDSLQPVIRVVQIDPLYVEVPVPTAEASALACGQTAKVIFPGATEPIAGKITNKASVADAASDTLMIRVEVLNTGKRPAGEHVQIILEPAAASSATASEAKPQSSSTTDKKES